MPQIEQKSIRNLGIYGVIREAEVDSSLIPDGAVTEAMNFHFDRKGASTVRPGIATLGATIATGYPIWGLFNASTGTLFAAVSQSSSMRIYAYPGAAWGSSLTGGTANVRIRFLEAAGRTIVLNFGNASNMYSSIQFLNTSESWVTTGNPINPQAITDQVAGSVQPQYGEVYKSRIYLAGGNTNGNNIANSRLWYSNVISSTGNFAWTPSTDFVDINPGDGESITGLRRFSLELVVFKPNYIYRFRTSGIDPDPLIRIGTRSNESIVEGKKGLYFHHDTGFYRYSGGYPEEISRPISDIVDAIPFSRYSTIAAWKDPDHIYWSLGNLTIAEPKQSVTWKNVVVRYTESSELWTVYGYANDIKLGVEYNSGSALSRVIGLDNGVVATLNSGTTDLGQPISYRMITKWYEWEIEHQKVISMITGLAEKSQNAQVMYQTNENIEWQNLGQLTKLVTFFEPQIVFNRIRFKITGVTSDEAMIFKGLDIPLITDEGIVK